GNVALVLELLHADAVLDDPLLAPERRDRLDHLAGDLDDRRGKRPGGLGRLGDLEEAHAADGAVDQVDDVVQPYGELVDVLAVDRRDEGPVDVAEDLVGDLVALVLEAFDLVGDRGDRALAAKENVENSRAFVDAPRHVGEALEVPLVARKEIEHGTPPPWKRRNGRDAISAKEHGRAGGQAPPLRRRARVLGFRRLRVTGARSGSYESD